MEIKNLKPGSHVHLMGVCGTAMASLAGLLKGRGFHVTGSELNPYPPMSTQIEDLGVQIMKPYKAANLNPKPDFIVVGNVISANNEEAQEMVRLQIPYTSLPKAMGDVIIDQRESIVISGTHGKTTTTSLMSWVAMELGLEPGFLIGGIAKNFSRSFQNPKGNYFVIEGDEYDTAYFDKVPKFVHYKPKHVILTSVEFDHADIYADLNAVKSAFAKLLSLIPVDGTLVYCAEDQNVCELVLASQYKGNKASYGIRKGDIQADILSVTEKGTTFKAKRGSEIIGEFQTIMTGDYNIQNALGVITLCLLKNFDMKKVQTAFKTFQGVKRRQEILGEPNGVLVIEDFAHHPTAVRETVKGIKSKYNGRKIFAVFEPRSATSRRKIFQQDYAKAFKDADEVLIMKAFDQGKIDEANRFSSDELVADIKITGKKAHAFENVEQIVIELKKQSRKGDLILIMSNGGFDGIYNKLIKALSV